MKSFGAIVACFFIWVKAIGMSMWSYDLDSLTYMAPVIAEGEVGPSHQTNNFKVWEIKITSVHKGAAKAGETLEVAALDFYHKPTGEGFRNTARLQPGDKLFLFLDLAHDTMFYDHPEKFGIYWPVSSGIKLVVGDKVVGFSQYDNPGPYLAETFGLETNNSVPTLSNFREELKQSIARSDKWKPLLDRPASTNDLPALLQLLEEREGRHERWLVDIIPDVICKRIAESHDIAALANASQKTNLGLAVFTLKEGFNTTAGRDFLLTAIDDPKLSAVERLKFASVLPFGLRYDSVSPSNGFYVKQIASVAVAARQDPRLRKALLGYLESQSYNRIEYTPGVERDVKDAESLLKDALTKANSEEGRYELERALTKGREEYQVKMFYPPVIGILRARDPHDNYTAPGGRFTFAYDWITLQSRSLNVRVAFVNQQTGKKWTAPSSRSVDGRGESSGSDEVSKPAGLSSGHYRVFYEFLEKDNIICSSHYFETDL